MKFEMNHKIGTDYSTVRFTAGIYAIKFKLPVIESFETSFSRLGGVFCPDEECVWRFPKHITFEVISEVIYNTCFVCGGLMKDGQALNNTYVSFDDFGNDAGRRGTTQEKSGTPVVKQVRKCSACGHSHT